MNPKPKPLKADRPRKKKTSKPYRAILEKQVEAVLKEIIFWRDSQVCVMGEIDGGRCGNGLMWNHVIAQGMSSWMKLEIGNVYVGCGSHNLLDKMGDKTIAAWLSSTFGAGALGALQAEMMAHHKQRRNVVELECLLAHYDYLFQNRFYVNPELPDLIKAGYYGSIIQGVWKG
jgi:hypothetical protein